MTNSKVVLRQLQGMVLPSNKENIFRVTFRFSETDDGFMVTMQNCKMKVPTEGKVMPLTLVLQVMARRGVVVVPSLGSWMEFKINWPKDDISNLDETDLDDDLELLLDQLVIMIMILLHWRKKIKIMCKCNL